MKLHKRKTGSGTSWFIDYRLGKQGQTFNFQYAAKRPGFAFSEEPGVSAN
jgi:hypothetical protein